MSHSSALNLVNVHVGKLESKIEEKENTLRDLKADVSQFMIGIKELNFRQRRLKVKLKLN